MDLIAGFNKVNDTLDELGFIPPLINIIIEYSKCWCCYDVKHRMESNVHTNFDDKESICLCAAKVAKTDKLNIYVYKVSVCRLHRTWIHMFVGTMHVDLLTYSIAHKALVNIVNAVPYHTK